MDEGTSPRGVQSRRRPCEPRTRRINSSDPPRTRAQGVTHGREVRRAWTVVTTSRRSTDLFRKSSESDGSKSLRRLSTRTFCGHPGSRKVGEDVVGSLSGDGQDLPCRRRVQTPPLDVGGRFPDPLHPRHRHLPCPWTPTRQDPPSPRDPWGSRRGSFTGTSFPVPVGRNVCG